MMREQVGEGATTPTIILGPGLPWPPSCPGLALPCPVFEAPIPDLPLGSREQPGSSSRRWGHLRHRQDRAYLPPESRWQPPQGSQLSKAQGRTAAWGQARLRAPLHCLRPGPLWKEAQLAPAGSGGCGTGPWPAGWRGGMATPGPPALRCAAAGERQIQTWWLQGSGG